MTVTNYSYYMYVIVQILFCCQMIVNYFFDMVLSQDGFKGFACELCRDSNKFGSYCNESKYYMYLYLVASCSSNYWQNLLSTQLGVLTDKL